MKHCKNCEYCRLDLVADYVKSAEIYKCDKTNDVILDPFWEVCEHYKKAEFEKEGVMKLLSDVFCGLGRKIR